MTNVAVRRDKSSETGLEWSQIQLAPAYGSTLHKAQGLTVPTTYLGLTHVSGFGLPYTAFTRTPFKKQHVPSGSSTYGYLGDVVASRCYWHE